MRRIDHPLYHLWHQMMYRCYSERYYRFRDYGGRGIAVFESWHDLYAFADWIDLNLGPCPAGHSIDRVDNDGNYEPGNVRWATIETQNLNKRDYRPRSAPAARWWWPA